jgi:MFS family permease
VQEDNGSCDPQSVDTVRESIRAFGCVFSNRGLRRLEIAWAISIVSTWAYGVAVAVFAYEAGGARAVGIVGFGRYAAAAAASPWLALLADRYPRQLVMAVSDAVRVVVLAAASVAVFANAPAATVYLLAILAMVAAMAVRPAQAALVPSLAETPEELTAANVVASTVQSVGIFGGPAIGGVLLVATSVGTVLALTAGALLVSVIFVLGIRAPSPPVRTPSERQASMFDAFVAGFATIGRDRSLRLVIGLFSAVSVVSGFVTVAIVVLALRTLGLGDSGVGWLTSAIGVGGVLGGLLSAGMIGRPRLAVMLGLGVFFWGVAIVVIGLHPVTWAALVLLGIAGVANVVVDVAGFTLLQRTAADHVLGRVFGVLGSLMLGSMAVGAALGPPLIDTLGLRTALIVVGGVLSVAVPLSWKRLLAIDRAAAVPLHELELLRGIPIFAPLAAPELERLARSLAVVDVPRGAAAVTRGDHGDRFYIVDAGRAAVETDGGRAGRELGPGEFFGEIALLRDVPRTATVRALEPLRLYALDRDPFIATVTGHAPSSEAAEKVIAARLAGPVRA